MNYCRENDKKNKYEIYIWRYTKEGKIKTAKCCNACTKLVNKYNYQNKIYTFDENNKKTTAISDNPEQSLAYRILHGIPRRGQHHSN